MSQFTSGLRASRPGLVALALSAGVAALLAHAPALAQGANAELACANALQGKVAWNQQGNVSWSPDNLRRLCQGSTQPEVTVACFQAEIRRHNDWARGIAACQSGQSGAAAPGTNGRNATAVVFGQAGQRLGSYRQVAPRQWVEADSSGTVGFRFEEVQRDDWSVYLLDRSRGVNIQLDLHTRKVMYSDASSARRELYGILGASGGAAAAPAAMAAAQPAPQAQPQPAPAAPAAAAAPNGRNTVVVTYGQGFQRLGELRRVGARAWQESDAAGNTTYRFEEVQRDDWSVYLVDRSRGVSLQLDLHTRKVMYSEASGPRRELYEILAAGL